MAEHFVDYGQGTGDLQQPDVERADRKPDAALARPDWPLDYDLATGSITLGTRRVNVAEACEHVKRLQIAIWEAVHGRPRWNLHGHSLRSPGAARYRHLRLHRTGLD